MFFSLGLTGCNQDTKVNQKEATQSECSFIRDPFNVFSTKRIEDIQLQVTECLKTYHPSEIMVAVDVDMTLIQPTHPALTYKYIKKYQGVYREALSKLDANQRLLPFMYIASAEPHQLVDVNAPTVFKSLQDQGVKVIGFAASSTGKLGSHSRFEEFRYQQLKAFGFEFSGAFAEQDVILREFQEHNGSYPVYYKGILFSNGKKGDSGKGLVMKAFLQKEYKPKVLIMIDDKKHNLHDVADALAKWNPKILFIGLEYSKAYDYAPEKMSMESFQKKWIETINAARTLSY